MPLVRCLPVNSTLRTQSKNIARSRSLYAAAARAVMTRYGRQEVVTTEYRLAYSHPVDVAVPIYQSLQQSVGMKSPYHLALGEPATSRRKIIVIRPGTVRTEWMASARNPKQEYVQAAIDFFNSQGFETIVVADMAPMLEVYASFRPLGASTYYENGELSVTEVIELVRSAHGVVSGVGFMVPLCQAVGTPAVILHGGAGGYNSPWCITAPSAIALHHVLPRPYCLCRDYLHNCHKIIDPLTPSRPIRFPISNPHKPLPLNPLPPDPVSYQ